MFRHLSKLSRFLQPASFAQSNIFQSNLRNFSLLTSNILQRCVFPSISNQLTTSFLQPTSVTVNSERGMKQMGKLKRRCKDCYFVVRQERLYVMCKTHGRHKQMAMKKKPKNTWILTDATQSKQRAW